MCYAARYQVVMSMDTLCFVGVCIRPLCLCSLVLHVSTVVAADFLLDVCQVNILEVSFIPNRR